MVTKSRGDILELKSSAFLSIIYSIQIIIMKYSLPLSVSSLMLAAYGNAHSL